jgi:hypothetical protein
MYKYTDDLISQAWKKMNKKKEEERKQIDRIEPITNRLYKSFKMKINSTRLRLIRSSGSIFR